MKINRRQVLGLGSAAAVTLACPAYLRAQGTKKLRWGVSIKAMNVAIINSVLGQGLGYAADEGFEIEPVMLGTNSNVQIALDKGDVDFGVGVGPFQLPLFAKGDLPPIVNFYEWAYPYRWDVAVLPDSPIQKYEDLKGKTVGVSALGTTDYPVTRAVLAQLGLDPDADVTWVATGAGVPAGVALQRGDIDAMAYFDTGFGQIEAAGIEIRMLTRPEKIPLIGGLYVSGMKDSLEEKKDMAIGFGRSIAKASEFILANPAAGAKVFLEMYPETAPRGVSQANAIQTMLYSIKRRMEHFKPPYPDTKMGYIHESELAREAEFLGLSIPSVSPLVTNAFIDAISDFDVTAVQQQARDYPV